VTDWSIEIKPPQRRIYRDKHEEIPRLIVQRLDADGVTLNIRRETDFIFVWLSNVEALAVAAAITDCANKRKERKG
jgi:hypothetical protein